MSNNSRLSRDAKELRNSAGIPLSVAKRVLADGIEERKFDPKDGLVTLPSTDGRDLILDISESSRRSYVATTWISGEQGSGKTALSFDVAEKSWRQGHQTILVTQDGKAAESNRDPKINMIKVDQKWMKSHPGILDMMRQDPEWHKESVVMAFIEIISIIADPVDYPGLRDVIMGRISYPGQVYKTIHDVIFGPNMNDPLPYPKLVKLVRSWIEKSPAFALMFGKSESGERINDMLSTRRTVLVWDSKNIPSADEPPRKRTAISQIENQALWMMIKNINEAVGESKTALGGPNLGSMIILDGVTFNSMGAGYAYSFLHKGGREYRNPFVHNLVLTDSPVDEIQDLFQIHPLVLNKGSLQMLDEYTPSVREARPSEVS